MQHFNVDLTSRFGLPDSVAHLRSGYPRSAWRFHPNCEGLTAYWLNIHAQLRSEAGSVGADLLAAQNDPLELVNARYASMLGDFLNHLDMHHRIEDASLFPGFRRAGSDAPAAIDVLEAVRTSGSALVGTPDGEGDERLEALDIHSADFSRLSNLLNQHFNDEEEIVVPAMLIHGQRVLGE